MDHVYIAALVVTWFGCVVDATIPTFWLLVHPFAPWWRRRSAVGLWLMAVAWLALWGIAGAATAPLLFRTLYRSGWSWPLGALGWAAGLALYRGAKRNFSHDQLLGRSELRPRTAEQRLVTSGVRARLRHPVYAGHFCLLAGNAAGSGLVANYLLLGWFLLTLPLMLHFEERELEQRFGAAYREYKDRVPAIIPTKRH